MPLPESTLHDSDTVRNSVKRVQLKHIQLDHDFFEKPKIIGIAYKFGHIGTILYVQSLCDMGRATDGEIDVDCIRYKARSIGGWSEEQADEFIQYCIERDLYHVGSKDYLVSNRRIQDDQQAMAESQEVWRNKKRAQRERENGKSPTQDSRETTTETIPETVPENVQGHTGDNVETCLRRMKTEHMNTELDIKKIDISNSKVLGRWVIIGDIEYEACLMEFARMGLTPAVEWLKRAATLMDFDREKKPEKRHFSAAMEITTWPIRVCLEEQAKGRQSKAAEVRLQRARDPNTGPPNQQNNKRNAVPGADATRKMLDELTGKIGNGNADKSREGSGKGKSNEAEGLCEETV